MNADLAQELLNELGSSLENLETQHAALLHFLKDTGVVPDDQFAPYLTQAGKASSVRWRAAHIRLDRLITTERENEEKLRGNTQLEKKAGEAPLQDQDKDAKARSEKDRNGAAKKGEVSEAKGAVADAGQQPVAVKDDKQGDVEPGKDKKSGQA